MAKSLNKCQFIGNAGKDPETRYSGSGMAICSFSLALNHSVKDKSSGQYKDETTWVNFVAFDKLAEIAQQYIRKGDKTYVEGRLQTRTYDDKDGNKKYVTEIIVSDILLLGNKQNSDGQARSAQSQPVQQSQGIYDGQTNASDDLPF